MTGGNVPGILRPSNAVRWASECAGNHAFEQGYPTPEDTDEAREGTAGHFYVTEALQGRVWPVGHITPNGVPIDQDMVDGGQHLIDDVRAALATCSDSYVLRVEAHLTMYNRVHPDNEGTPDVVLIDLVTGRIWIWDYKYGHRWVDPYGNLQMIDYFAGVLEACSLTDEDAAGITVSLRIVSPRNYQAPDPVRDWTTTGAELIGRVRQLASRAHLAKRPGQLLTSGPQCRDCPAQWDCPAALTLGAYILDYSRQPVPANMKPAALGLTLTKITTAKKRLEALEDGLRAEAAAKIKRGQPVLGWEVGRKDTRETWMVDTAAVVALGELYGVKVLKPADKASTACITPNQARAAGIPADMIQHYARKPLGDETLVAVDPTAANRIFAPPT